MHRVWMIRKLLFSFRKFERRAFLGPGNPYCLVTFRTTQQSDHPVELPHRWDDPFRYSIRSMSFLIFLIFSNPTKEKIIAKKKTN